MTRRRLIPVALIALAALALGVVLLGGSGSAYTVKAEFTDVAGLRKNSNVKVGGVPGGTIVDLDVGKGDVAVATIELDEGVEIGPGARADARPVNLLGEKYVDLTPGDIDSPEPSGTVIPTSRTSAPVELDDVLNVLRPNVRAAMRVLINEAGIAMAGRGSDFNTMLEKLPPALDQTSRVVQGLSADTRKLGDLVEQGDRVLAAIDPKRGDLADLVDEAGKALEVTADRRADLGRTVGEGAGTLRQLQATLGDLDATARQLVPASRQLRATAGPLRNTLTRIPGFVDDAKPLLQTAEDVSSDLGRLGRTGAPIVRRIRPTAQRLEQFTKQLAPLVATLDGGGGLDGLLGLMNGWANTIQNSDGLGHQFRLRAEVDETAVATIADRLRDPAKRKKASRSSSRPPAQTPVPSAAGPAAPGAGPAPARPALPKLPVPDLPGIDLDDQLRDPSKAMDDVSTLLDYMLGG